MSYLRDAEPGNRKEGISAEFSIALKIVEANNISYKVVELTWAVLLSLCCS